MESLKVRINAAITTMRKWPNVVNVDGDYYGVYFHGKEICVIHSSDALVEELPVSIVEKIVQELESGRYEVNKAFQG